MQRKNTAGDRAIMDRAAPGFLIIEENQPAPRNISRLHRAPVRRNSLVAKPYPRRVSRQRPSTVYSATILEMATGKPAVAKVENRVKKL